MRIAAAVVAMATLVAACAMRDPWVLATGQHPQEFHRTITERVDVKFLLFLPAGFDPHGATKYPLLIFLHGSGESGDDLNSVKVQGPPKIVESTRDFPFIVASPQSTAAYLGFSPAKLNAMLDELIARLPVDPDRVYLTGLSMGGRWSYGWASLNPERFAAIAPVSGDWDLDGACRLRDVPVWAFHGAKDTAVPLAGDLAMIEAIKECHGDARISVLPDLGHNAWDTAYGDPALYAWFLAHRRSTNLKPHEP
jgi:predicted peptidase